MIWDEEEYEGNISAGWGQLSGQQMADRFWWGASLGVFTGHSETILRANVKLDDDQPLWWAKGGSLVGQAPRRIAWLRHLQGPSSPPPCNKKGYSSTYVAMGFANVRAGTWYPPSPTHR